MTQHEAIMNFMRSLANMTTPEDEIAETITEHGALGLPNPDWADETPSDETFFAEMDSFDRQAGEYAAFMSMIRDARKLLTGEATADSGHVAPSPSVSRLVVTVRGGIAEIQDAEGLPDDLQVFIVDYDCDESDGGNRLDKIEGELAVLSVATGKELNAANTGHFGKVVARTWADATL